jgi:hypothetical protein
MEIQEAENHRVGQAGWDSSVQEDVKGNDGPVLPYDQLVNAILEEQQIIAFDLNMAHEVLLDEDLYHIIPMPDLKSPMKWQANNNSCKCKFKMLLW